MQPLRSIPLFLCALSLLLAGCAAGSAGKGKKGEDDYFDPVEISDDLEGFKTVKLDLNGDQQSDVTNYIRVGEGPETARMVRKEIDLNFDGKVDVIQLWKDGEMTQEQMDADFDGQIEWTDFYSAGERIRAEWDTRFDGQPDVIRHYEDGKLSKLEMDTSGDQKMDYWEYYEGGVMQRSGHDTNGDGKIDQWGER
ncbi:MAG: hypothetical protein VX498_13595 [Myxococcota bacterium]|nr:hypothetical protein [Myxococcota bacterium]